MTYYNKIHNEINMIIFKILLIIAVSSRDHRRDRATLKLPKGYQEFITKNQHNITILLLRSMVLPL